MSANDELGSSAVQSLDEGLRGELLLPDDERYDDARSVWNGMIDKHPSVIARCTGAADVAVCVDFARQHELSVSVKGGGHNVAGRAITDGGITLDMSDMDYVRVSPSQEVAIVGPGCRWGDVDHETQAYGLATTGGVDSRTGIAGLTLGGGWGWLARKHGMAVDNLRRVDLVTAEGELVLADAETNSDLFWAVRGGGGNFGIVTAFEYDIHPVGPEVMTAQILHPTADIRGALDHFQAFMRDAPDEVGAAAIMLTVPPMDPYPEEHHGTTAVSLAAMHSGDLAEGESVLGELADYGNPILSAVEPMPYTVFQEAFNDVSPTGERYYYKSQFVEELPDEALDTLLEFGETLPGAYSLISLEAMGGAINRIPEEATAFPHRDASFDLGIYGGWSDPARDAEIMEWAQRVAEAMQPYSTGGVYANYLDRDEGDRGRGAFDGNYERLAEIKQKWDPKNLFEHNVTIET